MPRPAAEKFGAIASAHVKPRYLSMRLIITLFIAASPAAAWNFSPSPICTVTHETPEVALQLTYDPRVPEYSISLTRVAPWIEAPVFAMRFDGPRGLTITTGRHILTENTLTVSDSGFGNVLNGLEFNTTATAFTDTQSVAIPLSGAAPTIQAFRACIAAPAV